MDNKALYFQNWAISFSNAVYLYAVDETWGGGEGEGDVKLFALLVVTCNVLAS